MLTYRKIEGSDTKDLMDLIEEYCIEYGIDYKQEFIRSTVEQITSNKLVYTIGVFDEEKQKIIAGISYITYPHPYSGVKVGRKTNLFVAKDYRGKEIGKTVIEKAESHCKELGVKLFFLSSPKTIKGYKQFEIDQVKEL